NHSTRQWRTVECQKQQRDLLSKSGYSLSFCAIILQTDDIWLVPKGQLLRKHTPLLPVFAK
ncbi:hypothetical protein, partial [Bacteroides fragilis]|uniref:hypothetical protein n=1 Tax=Bacteroides fragilis TaxID=817 RepID=UPI001C9DA855